MVVHIQQRAVVRGSEQGRERRKWRRKIGRREGRRERERRRRKGRNEREKERGWATRREKEGERERRSGFSELIILFGDFLLGFPCRMPCRKFTLGGIITSVT